MKSLQAHFELLGGIEPLLGDAFRPLTQSEVESIEARIGATLPAEYAEFLLSYGAAQFGSLFVTIQPVIPLPVAVADDGIGFFVNFYGTLGAGYEDETIEWNLTNYEDRMPDAMIAIGEAGFGDQICLGIKGQERGKVYYWDGNGERCEDDYLDVGLEPPSDLLFRNVYLIANSFHDFITRLAPHDTT